MLYHRFSLPKSTVHSNGVASLKCHRLAVITDARNSAQNQLLCAISSRDTWQFYSMLAKDARLQAALRTSIQSGRPKMQKWLVFRRRGVTTGMSQVAWRMQRSQSSCTCSASHHALPASSHTSLQSLLMLAESPAEAAGTAPFGSLAAILLLLTG